MICWEEYKHRTEERFADPRPGDRFHEMFTCWIKVIDRCGEEVVIQEGFPGDWEEPRLCGLEELRRRYSYTWIPGYWMMYEDRQGGLDRVPTDPVERDQWWANLRAERTMRGTRVSWDSACL